MQTATHSMNESAIIYPWWIALSIIALLMARFLYVKIKFNFKASNLLSNKLGLRDYRQLEKLSAYRVFKHIMEVNAFKNNLFVDHGKKNKLIELENILMEVLIERAEKDKFQAKEIIEKIHDEKDAFTNDERIDWLLGLNIDEKNTVLDGSSWINEETGEQEVYQGAYYSALRQIVDRLKFNKKDVFYDLGSGYGRVPFYFAINTKLDKIRGIELIERRVNECNRVRDSLDLNQVEFIRANARDWNFSDGDIFFMFNPFTNESLEYIVNKLREVAKNKPIQIISFGLCNNYINKQLDWLTLTDTIKWKSKVYGQGVLFFESRLHSH